MQLTRKVRIQWFVQGGIFVVLLALAVALLAFVAHEHRSEFDITQNGRNTLTPATREILSKLNGPVTVTVYAMQQDPRGDLRKMIRNFFAPYERLRPDLKLVFIDPREEPKLAKAAGIRANGETVIEYARRNEHLTDYNEQAFANALMRLMRTGERLVFALDGHGERRLDGIANHDLGEFGKQLASKGFKTSSLNLALAQEVPANTSMLLIASPQVDLQPAEIQKIRRYIERGGNLLWLVDQEPLHGLQPLAELLGIDLGPGTIVDPDAARFNGSPALAIAASYGRHPVTDNFRLNTVFPFARRVGVNEESGWRATPLVEVAPRGWLEMGKLDDKVTFDKARDVPGPVSVAVALERRVNERPQRAVVVGTGNFLANTYLGNGGNLDLGVNIVNWLSGDDALIAIQPRPTVDSGLALERGALYAILFAFLIVLPLAFAAAGVLVWWRRRRA
jgi:ABC-type uncharacterized transport system involved in gliding motility auxiliary subunit